MKIFWLFLIAIGLVSSGLAAYAQTKEPSSIRVSLSATNYAALEQIALKKYSTIVKNLKPVQRNAADKAFSGETNPVLLRGLMGKR